MDRRSLLKLSLPWLAFPWTSARAAVSEEAEALFVVLDGATADVPADRLQACVEPFLESGIPVGIVPALEGAQNGAGAAGAYLRFLNTRFGDRVELIARLPPLSGLAPYFQRRAASDALASLRAALAQDGAAAGDLLPVTAATHAKPADYDTLRALGLRNVLVLEESLSTVSAGCSTRAVCLVGSRRLDPWGEADPGRRTGQLLAQPGPVLLRIDLEGLAAHDPEEVRRGAETVAFAIGTVLAEDRRFAVLPREHVAWMSGYQPRLVSIIVAAPPAEGAAASGFRAIAEDLLRLGLPYSVTGAPGSTDHGVDCVDLDVTGADALRAWLAARPSGTSVCATAKDGAVGALADLAPDLAVVPVEATAFDERALLLHGTTSVSRAGRLLGDGRMRDAVIAVDSPDYATPEARAVTARILRALAQSDGTVCLALPDYARRILTPDPLLDLLNGTRRNVAMPEPVGESPSRDRLMADARLAWSYFERFSVASSGLCMDTVHQTEGDLWLHREITMWDLGSLIAAVMAAHELGLIDDASFVARAGALSRALRSAQLADRRLPAAVISASTARPLTTDFNACDTGRLLSVLREFDAHPLSRGLAAETVAGWDLKSVIPEGRLHSVVGGRLADRHGSHCTHYAARALRSWGHAVTSPYEGPEGLSDADRRMTLLHAVAEIGPYGAEPLLTEGIEMGLSDPSRFLADALFDAQRRAYQSTGELRCVSEAPLDRPPWFSYQGFAVDRPEDPWAVIALSSDPAYHTPEFQREVTLVNTKAAFLWAALRPGAHATRLWAHVSERARLEGMGFSPGVYAATGAAMSGYSDVNTNALVLQAIAYILRGHRPRLPPATAP